MKKLFYYLLAAGILLACTLSSAPAVANATKTPVPPTPPPQPPTATPRKTAEWSPPTATPRPGGPNYTVLYLHPSGGSLMNQLEDQAQIAVDMGQIPILYFTASW